MKKIVLFTMVTLTTYVVNAQATKSSSTAKKNMQVYAAVSPFLATFQLVSVNAGVEFKKYQMGVSFTKGNHHFTHGLSKTTFKNFGDLHFLHNQSEEISIIRYFKNSRKGFYVGLLFNLTHWDVQNHAEAVTTPIVGKYITAYSGYRWFPKIKNNDMFYLEPNFGVSARLNGEQFTTVGTKSFSFGPLLELTPNVYIGARFRLSRKK